MGFREFDVYADRIRAVVDRFCSRQKITRQMIAQDIRVKPDTFYKVIEGKQTWPQGLAIKVYEYMNAADPLSALRFLQAFFADPQIAFKANGQLVTEILLELNAEVFDFIHSGADARKAAKIATTADKLIRAAKKQAESK